MLHQDSYLQHTWRLNKQKVGKKEPEGQLKDNHMKKQIRQPNHHLF
jgi:hypothetical protein